MKKLFKFSFATLLFVLYTVNVGICSETSKLDSKNNLDIAANLDNVDSGCTFNENPAGVNVGVRAALIVNLNAGECEAQVNLVTPATTGAVCTVVGPSSGIYPIGTTTVSWTIQECPDQILRQDIIVNNYQGSGIIACNDLVQISLDDDCITVVSPDQILEGNNYGCYDYYTVEISDTASGVSYGNTLTEANIGQTLSVKITDQTNNSCWGTISVEDKNPTPLNCRDVWTRCHMSTTPGSPATSTYEVVMTPNLTINEGATPPNQITVFNIMDDALNGFTAGDLNISLDITHPNVSELRASLQYTYASGVMLPVTNLFDLTATACSSANISLTLDDESANPYASLLAACGTGTFAPQAALSAYDGVSASGMFTLRIYDNNNNASSGTLNSVTLSFTKDTNIVTYPGPDNGVYVSTGPFTYSTEDMDACGTATLNYSDVVVEQDCSEPYKQIITRSWFALDAQGNNSSCIQTIYVYRNDLSDLTFPPNYDDSPTGESSLSCSLYGSSVPTPSVTGVPTGTFCDNVQIFDPIDTRIDICALSYKIVRRWKVVDWCTGEIVEHDQVIKVEDTEGPEIICPADLTIGAGAYDCSGATSFSKPSVGNECSPSVTYRMFYALADATGNIPANPTYTEVFASGSNYSINDLPFGTTQIKWIVEDDCENNSECTFLVTVIDSTPPIAVCDQFTVASIGSDGWAVIQASSFDDGSNDNCGIVSYRARRTTNSCSAGNTDWGSDVRFCCNEIGESIMVEYEVQDAAGNSNTCMVEVSVQDKLPPYITTCPADITLDCQTMDITNLAVTGEPIAIDNCGIVDVEFADTGSLDQCGEGTFTRVWKVTDGVGLQASCVQTITVVDSDPFDRGDITWPPNYDATSNGQACDPNLEPSTLGFPWAEPRLNDDFCSLTASTYEDQVFYFVDGACVKILRTWTVIDWCTYDPATNAGIYTHVQVLKVENTTAPTFLTSCGDRSFCIYGDNCDGSVTLTTEVADDCTPTAEITVTYEIHSITSAGTTLVTSGSGLTVTRTLVPGNYSIEWQAEDHCGNIGVCAYDFEVEDCKAPTPYCYTAVTSVVMNNSGSLSIWANDFNLGSYDNCTSQIDLVYSFSSDTTQTSLTFTCDDIPDGESNFISVEMWVTDLAGNQDFCTVNIDLQDNNANACVNLAPGFAFIKGNIRTSNNQMVSNAAVAITSNQSNLPYVNMTTAADGGYSFTSLPHYGNYSVTSTKNDDVMNGVSTLDLALIQKHILGIQSFDSAYKTIAADVDNNEGVSALDLVWLRKLILGVVSELPNNQESWRFVDSSDQFSNISDPFPYDEVLEFVSLNQSQSDRDFIAVKIGDVNGNANPNNIDGESPVEGRNNLTTHLVIDEQTIEKGNMVTIPVYATDFNEMIGFQMSIDFDPSIMSFKSWELGYLDMADENFGFVNADEGIVTTSWTTIQEVSIDESTPLFTLTFLANMDANISEAIDVNSIITRAEAYNVNLEVSNIELSFKDENNQLIVQGLEVYQNTPNPFSRNTTIAFYTPRSTQATLNVYDMTGRLIHTEVNQFSKGENNFVLTGDEINTAGLLYYSVEADGVKVTKKMVSMK